MYTTVGILSSYISHVSGPFHPFGGAVDIVVVEQQDGTFKSTPWYVKFGKFQGVLKHREKIVAVGVNDVNAGFHMHLDHKGEAYFLEDASSSDEDDKQPFSPPSGPSSGDEEILAIEYNKTEEGQSESIEYNKTEEGQSESGDEQEVGSELQFTCEESRSEYDGPATSLFANSALMSIQKVAENGGEEHEEEEEVVAASFTSKNGDYLVNSYDVTQVVDKSYVVKEDVVISELEKQSSSEMEKPVTSGSVSGEEPVFNEELAVPRKVAGEQEKAWTEVITKAAAVLQDEPEKKEVSESSNVERRTWAWWVWRGSGASTVKKAEQTKAVAAEKLKVEEVVEEHESESSTSVAPQRSRSMLGMMFGGGGKEQVKDINAENVMELLDNRWTVGSRGKSQSSDTFVKTGDEQSETSRAEGENDDGPEESPEEGTSKERSVDLSTAEVVLMSVDGHVVVAKQDEFRSSRTSGAEERFSRAATAPISVPGRMLLERTDSTELKVGSESTLDTSPHRTDYGRLSNSLSSYFVAKDGKSSAAVDPSVSSIDASQFPSAVAAEVDEAVEKSSMDVQVGSPWSTVSVPAVGTDVLKTEEPGKEITKNAGFELSLCRHLLKTGMGADAAARVFDEHKLTASSFTSSASLMGNEALVVRVGGKYYPSGVAASILFGLLAFGQLIPPKDGEPIQVEASESKDLVVKPDTRAATTGGWRFWPFAFRRPKPSDAGKVVSGDALLVATEAALHNSIATGLIKNGYYRRSWKLKRRTLIPTSDQLASLNLQPGRNKITFTFTTRVLGQQQVDARIYLWKWNTKVVISDVDGTITKSDVLGQVMPLVGRDWTQTGVTRLFSAIKDNGYELMFLSARAISQAYLTRQFLKNLKQDGEPLPDGPVVISPDGLFPSLYREVIRRAPQEFKIACLEDIKSLFPSECQPFYAGFGNRDTDEISYLKVGIPKGKIFIINPKGEVIVNNILDMRSYTSLHKLVNDMFPPVNLAEREDFNSWNYWKMPIPSID